MLANSKSYTGWGKPSYIWQTRQESQKTRETTHAYEEATTVTVRFLFPLIALLPSLVTTIPQNYCDSANATKIGLRAVRYKRLLG